LKEPRGIAHISSLEVGRRLRAARARVGVTRRQLAQASTTSERYLANLETGQGNPSIGVLASLADALQVPMAELLPLGGERDEEHAALAEMVRRLSPARAAAAMEWLRRPASADRSKADRVVLIGLRGAGKSSLGAALAQRLKSHFVEISKEVESAYGAQIGLLIELGGQGALRRYEAQAWESVIERNESVVIATPGGIVADHSLFDRVLATAHSIWLQASPEDHMARVLAQGDFRPMEQNREAMADLQAILDARSSDYARADAMLNTSEQDFETTLSKLEAIALHLIGHAM